MKPYSAFYYVKENRKRSLLLMLMIILSFGVYVGGLYVTNPYDSWQPHIETYEKIVSVGANSADDTAYRSFLKEAASSGKVTVIEMGTYNGMNWETIMGIGTGQCAFSFRSVEDFKTFCELMEIECDYDNLKSGSMIMSDRFAKNRRLSIGDKIDKSYEWNIFSEFTLDAITEEEGYILYFINEEDKTSTAATLIGNGIEGEELYDYVYGLQNQLDNPRDVFIYKGVKNDIDGQFEVFDLIYLFIALLLAIILAVTINAAFVSMYQRREFEFSVYRAIGISRRRIIGKIAGELLLIDAIALAVGTVAVLLGLYLFNNLVLYPAGKYLRYFNQTALFYMVICNVIIIVPLIITRCRQMLKADICEY